MNILNLNKGKIQHQLTAKSKKGMALSTAICITAAMLIFTAAIISIAVFNMNFSQRDALSRQAYLTVKSALGYCESYYSENDVPGVTDLDHSAAYFVFNGDVKDGADVYCVDKLGTSYTYGSGSSKGASITETEVFDKLKNAKSYVKAYYSPENTDANGITTKENFRLDGYSSVGKLLSGSGDQKDYLSLVYSIKNAAIIPTGDDEATIEIEEEYKYVNIHVKPYSDTGLEPYIYTWAYNDNNIAKTLSGSTSVVKLSGEWLKGYTASNLRDTYDNNGNKIKVFGDGGPQGSMQYEGDGWYVYPVMVPKVTDASGSTYYPQSINAIITKQNAARNHKINSNGTISYGTYSDGQTPEIYGIPLPDGSGVKNASDVYVTLNTKSFIDYPNKSLFTDLTYRTSIKDTISVYQKKQNTNFHFRVAGQTDDNRTTGTPHLWVKTCKLVNGKYVVSGDFVVENETMDYEGYGWYRHSGVDSSGAVMAWVSIDSDNFDDAVLVTNASGGTLLLGGQVAQSDNQSEIGRQLFFTAWPNSSKTGVNGDVGITAYATESAANGQFIAGVDTNNDAVIDIKDPDAANYTTLYAQGINQNSNTDPDKHTVTISYNTVTVGDSASVELDTAFTARVKLSAINNGSNTSVADGIPFLVQYTDVDQDGVKVKKTLSATTQDGYLVVNNIMRTGKYYFYVDSNSAYYSTNQSNSVYFEVVKTDDNVFANYLSSYDGKGVANRPENNQVAYGIIQKVIIKVNFDAQNAASLKGVEFTMNGGSAITAVTDETGVATFTVPSLSNSYTITQSKYISNDYYTHSTAHTFTVDSKGLITDHSDAVQIQSPANLAYINVTNIIKKNIYVQFVDVNNNNIDINATIKVDNTTSKTIDSANKNIKDVLGSDGTHRFVMVDNFATQYFKSSKEYEFTINSNGTVTTPADFNGISVVSDTSGGYILRVKLVSKPGITIKAVDTNGDLIAQSGKFVIKTIDASGNVLTSNDVNISNGASQQPVYIGNSSDAIYAGSVFKFTVEQADSISGYIADKTKRTFSATVGDDLVVKITADNSEDTNVSVNNYEITYKLQQAKEVSVIAYGGNTTSKLLGNVQFKVTSPSGSSQTYNTDNTSGVFKFWLNEQGTYTVENISAPSSYYINSIDKFGKSTITVGDTGVTSNNASYDATNSILPVHLAPVTNVSLQVNGVDSTTNFINVTDQNNTSYAVGSGPLTRVQNFSKSSLINSAVNNVLKVTKAWALIPTGATLTGKVYFDNTDTNWSSVYVFIGHSGYIRSYEMTAENGEAGIYATSTSFNSEWGDATGIFFGNSDGGVSGGVSNKNINSTFDGVTSRTVNNTTVSAGDTNCYCPSSSSGTSIATTIKTVDQAIASHANAPVFSDTSTTINVYVGNTATLASTATITGGTTPTYSTTCTSANSANATIGNATTATPTFKATVAGTYTVVTTATNPTTSATATKTYAITVTDPPTLSADLIAVLKGEKVMFYYGDSWGSGTKYLRATGSTSDVTTSGTSTSGSVSGQSFTYNYVSACVAPLKYYYSNSNTWIGDQFGEISVAGKAYADGVNGHNVTAYDSKSGFNTYATTATMTVGASSVNISATLANTTSVVGKTNQVKYYITSDNATFNEFSPSSTSSLTAGTYTVYPVAYDGTIYVRGDAITLTVNPAKPTLATPTLSVDKSSIKTGETAIFTAATTETGVSYVFTLSNGATETNTTGKYTVPTTLTAGTYTCTVKTTKTGYNDSALSSSVSLTVKARVYYTANISVNSSTAGSATINGGTTAVQVENDASEADRTVTLVATPKTGYTFVGWSKQSDATIFSTNTTATAIISANETYIANFAAIYTVNYSANYSSAGSVSAVVSGQVGNIASGSMVLTNTTVTFTATPASGYSFKEWQVNGVTSSTTTTTLNQVITANTTVVAVFSINPPTGVTLTGATTAYVGQPITFAASATSPNTLSYLTTCALTDATITNGDTTSPIFQASKTGSYTVTLTATAKDTNGNSNSATTTQSVTVSYSPVQKAYNDLVTYMASVVKPSTLVATDYKGGQSTIDAYTSVYNTVNGLLIGGLPAYNATDIYTSANTTMQQAVATLNADLLLTTVYFKTSSNQTNVYMYTWSISSGSTLTEAGFAPLTKVATGVESGTTYYVWRLQFKGTTKGIITSNNKFEGDVKFTSDMTFSTANQAYYVASNAVSSGGTAVTPVTYNPLAVTLNAYTGSTITQGDTVDLSNLTYTKSGTIYNGTNATVTYYVDDVAITGTSWIPATSGNHTIKVSVTDGYTATAGGAFQTAFSNQIVVEAKEPITTVDVDKKSQVFIGDLSIVLSKKGNVTKASYTVNGAAPVSITQDTTAVNISSGMNEGDTKVLKISYTDSKNNEFTNTYIYCKATKNTTSEYITFYFTKPTGWSDAHIWNYSGTTSVDAAMTKTGVSYTSGSVTYDVYSYTMKRTDAKTLTKLMFKGVDWTCQTTDSVNLIPTGQTGEDLNQMIFVVNTVTDNKKVTGSWMAYSSEKTYCGVGFAAIVKDSAGNLTYSPTTAKTFDQVNFYAVSKILSDNYYVSMYKDGLLLGDITDFFNIDATDNNKGTFIWSPTIAGEYKFVVTNDNGDKNTITITVSNSVGTTGQNLYNFVVPNPGVYKANVNITNGETYFITINDQVKGKVNTTSQSFTIIDNGDGTTSVNVNNNVVTVDPNILFNCIKISSDDSSKFLVNSDALLKDTVQTTGNKKKSTLDSADSDKSSNKGNTLQSQSKTESKQPTVTTGASANNSTGASTDVLQLSIPQNDTIVAQNGDIAYEVSKIKNILQTGADSTTTEDGKIQVAFFNGILPDSGASFTTWSEVYVNWKGSTKIADGYKQAAKQTITIKGNSYDYYVADVPDDCASIYFSSGSGGTGTTTVSLRNNTFVSIYVTGGTGVPTFYPKSTNSDGYVVCGTPTEFIMNKNTADDMSFDNKDITMVSTTANKTVYYNTPLTDAIVNAIKADKGITDTRSYIISSSATYKYVYINGNKLTNSGEISYKGATYYYSEYNDSASKITFADSTGKPYCKYGTNATEFSKGSYKSCLFYGEGASYCLLESGNYNTTVTTSTAGLDANRVGTSYAQSDVYDWYTYKIPTKSATSFTVKGLDGSKSYADDKPIYPVTGIEKTQDDPNLNTPIYVSLDSNSVSDKGYYNDVSVYTYNPNEANVNADKDGNKMVYFKNNENWSKVYVYYWGVDTNAVAWPGVEMTQDSLLTNGYKQVIPDNASYVIINNGKMDYASDCKKTAVMYFSGDENVYTHEQAVLYDSTQSTTKLSMYVNPRTRLIYALNYALGIYNRSALYKEYTTDTAYVSSSKVSLSMYKAMYDKALNICNSSSSTTEQINNQTTILLQYGAAYENLLQAVKQARIYLDETTNSSTSTQYIFPEGAYRPAGVTYTQYSIRQIESGYNTAMAYFSAGTTLTNQQKQYYYIDSVADLLMKAVSARKVQDTNVVQVQIKNFEQANWDESSIDLYVNDVKTTAKKYRTTLGNYIYVTVPTTSTSVYFASVKNGSPVKGDKLFNVNSSSNGIGFNSTGTQVWIYDAANKKWYEKRDDVQYIKYSQIKESDKSTMTESVYKFVRKNDNNFNLYFNYNLDVYRNDGTHFVIYAGLYKFDKTSTFWTNGIDLFSDDAMNYFKNKVNYGMNEETLDNNVYTASDKELTDILIPKLGGTLKTGGTFSGTSLSTGWINSKDVVIKNPDLSKTNSVNKTVNFHVGNYYYQDSGKKYTLYLEIPLAVMYQVDSNGKLVRDSSGNPQLLDDYKDYFLTCKMDGGSDPLNNDNTIAKFKNYYFNGSPNPVNLGDLMEFHRVDETNGKVVFKYSYDIATYQQFYLYCVTGDPEKDGGGTEKWRLNNYNINSQLSGGKCSTSADLDGKVITLSNFVAGNTSEFQGAAVTNGTDYGDKGDFYPSGSGTYNGGFAELYEAGVNATGTSDAGKTYEFKTNGKINFRFGYNTALDFTNLNSDTAGKSKGVTFKAGEVTFACPTLMGTSTVQSIDETSGQFTGNQHLYIYAQKITFLTNTKVVYYNWSTGKVETFTYSAGEYKLTPNKSTGKLGVDLLNPASAMENLEMTNTSKNLIGGVYLR